MLASVLGALLCAAASAYALAALLARGRATGLPVPAGPPCAVSVFKPLCGAELRLEENLSALCEQDHPEFEILCGVRDPGDGAIAVVERVRAKFPGVALRLVIDPRIHGSNHKVSNLINLSGLARHPWLVLADSDIAVAPDYLRRVTAPLGDATVGIVTCLYQGRPTDAFWARVAALFIDAWFVPSARLASALGSQVLGFGATIALTRRTLDAIGGFEAVRSRLADDYWLGELTRRLGLRTVLSDVCVITEVAEGRFGDVWSRELRWLRTIRSLNGPGFAFLFVTFTLPMLALGLVLAPTPAGAALAAFGVAARFALYWRAGLARRFWLAPLREGLMLVEWIVACFGDDVVWRDQVVAVADRVDVAHTPRSVAPGAQRFGETQ